MSKTLRVSLMVTTVIAASAALLLMGINIGRASLVGSAYGPGAMMGGFVPDAYEDYADGYMGSYRGAGMMGGMMGGALSPLADVEPLTVEDAGSAVSEYMETLGSGDFELGEVMVFDNQAYAQIIEVDTGIGAMEVLVDPVTKAVYPEFGPNMMWNTKYSPMGGYGMMGMMGGLRPADTAAEPLLSPADAIQAAQRYLDAYLPGTAAENDADPFYGYYTLHILRDGDVIGMLSVNSTSGQVFPHTWHGELLEMAEG